MSSFPPMATRSSPKVATGTWDQSGVFHEQNTAKATSPHARSRTTKLEPIPNLRRYDAAQGHKSEWVSVYTCRDIPGASSATCRCAACRTLPRMSIAADSDKQEARRLEYRVGDRVLLTGDRSGVVKWIGKFDSEYVSSELFVGVQLDDPVGSHNGIFRGKRYFTCPDYHGVFARRKEVLFVKGRYDISYRPLHVSGKTARPPPAQPSPTHAPAAGLPEQQAAPPPLPETESQHRLAVEKLREAQRRGEEWLRQQESEQQQAAGADGSEGGAAASESVVGSAPTGTAAGAGAGAGAAAAAEDGEESEALQRAREAVLKETEQIKQRLSVSKPPA